MEPMANPPTERWVETRRKFVSVVVVPPPRSVTPDPRSQY